MRAGYHLKLIITGDHADYIQVTIEKLVLSVAELLEAILEGPYIGFLRRAESQADSEKMSLKHPRFDTLRRNGCSWARSRGHEL